MNSIDSYVLTLIMTVRAVTPPTRYQNQLRPASERYRTLLKELLDHDSIRI